MNRFELKYLIHWNEYLRLVEELKPFCVPDRYGDASGEYSLISLYYDTHDYKFYHEKISGYDCRNKLRLRAYGGGTDSFFVEIKQKHNLNIFKWRAKMSLEQAYEYLQKPQCEAMCRQRDPKEMDALNRVAFLVDLYKLSPKIIISYYRKALVGIYDHGLRITFDTSLKYRGFDLKVEAGTYGKYFLPPQIVVLEIKVNNYFPAWLNKIVSRNEYEVQRVSKYCLGIQTQFNLRNI